MNITEFVARFLNDLLPSARFKRTTRFRLSPLFTLGLFFVMLSRSLQAGGPIYLGTNAGPFKSTDNGATFAPLLAKIGTTPHPLLRGIPFIMAITVDPQDPQTVYMVGMYPLSQGNNATALLKTTNAGETWTVAPLLNVGSSLLGFGGKIVIDPVATNVIYIYDQINLTAVRSFDRGATWSPLPLPPTSGGTIGDIAADPRVGRVLYARPYGNVLTDEQVFKSVDYGSTWTVLAKIPGGPRQGRVFVDPRNSRHLILTAAAVCTNGSGGCGPFRSTDGGISWTNQGFRGQDGGFGQAIADWVFTDVIYDPRTDKQYLSAELSGIGRVVLGSPDGATWTPLSNDPQFEAKVGSQGGAPLAADGNEGLALYTFGNRSSFTSNFVGPRLIVSTDGGSTWVTKSAVPRGCTEFSAAYFCPTVPTIFTIATPPATPDPIQNVSTASYVGGAFAPDSIISIFGDNLAPATLIGDGKASSLLGTSVTVIDSAGVSRQAPLFFVSERQVNYLVPAGIARGGATVRVTRASGATLQQKTQIVDVAPGIFTLNAAGLAAATLLRVSGLTQRAEGVFVVDSSGAVVAQPIDLGPPGDQVYLTLYGTGLRGAGTANTTFTINNIDVPVLYGGTQGEYAGLDQVNVLLPRSLAGTGTVALIVKAAGQPTNTVYLRFQ